MARNDTENFETEFGNRAHLRASADGWHAVASAAVAATLLVAVVGRHAVAGRRAALAPAVSDGAAIPVAESQRWHAAADRPRRFSNFCAQHEPVLCSTD